MTAKALGIPPSEAVDRYAHGDPDVVFGVAAAREEVNRGQERWRTLSKALKNLGRVLAKRG